MDEIPAGAVVGMTPAQIAAGFEGHVWQVQIADDHGVTRYQGKVTGKLTEEGLVEVVILGVHE